VLQHDDLVGLYAIIPTPATADAEKWDAVNTVDLAETERVLNRLIADGTDGLILLGTTGEAATLTREEYEAFVDCALATIRNRVPTFVGTSSLGLHESVYRTRFAAERGAEGILLGLPMWQPCTVDTAVAFYQTMSTAFPKTALMVYGNTRAFRFDFGPDFWSAVVKVAPTVMAAKFARPKDFPDAFAAAGHRPRFAFQLVGIAQQQRRPLGQALAGRGRMHRAGGPVEQSQAQARLQLLQALGQRRMGQALLIRGQAERAQPEQRIEMAQLAQIEGQGRTSSNGIRQAPICAKNSINLSFP